ncbi:glycoside hydrolase family 3 protein [Hydnum rufescens UP504]|uniref:beta-glucosidase n=1 Tax=Hydnum rufescens UP504 TaxID=1448309 RepID=A0A9P6DFI3_9AGAM|nr:glycoside hydrolase family 3 protein [Hydnum rufescens UP504]
MHEIYAHPFMRSVAADVASVMCSYNLSMSNSPPQWVFRYDIYSSSKWHVACEDEYALNDILKGEIGFQGYIMSDWSATHSTLSAEAGLDMTMPGDIVFSDNVTYFGQNLTDYVHNGTIAESRVNDMATRILAAYYLLSKTRTFLPSILTRGTQRPVQPARRCNQRKHQQLRSPQLVFLELFIRFLSIYSSRIAHHVAASSTILLKNIQNALPLQKPKTLVIIGSDAMPPPNGPNGFPDFGVYPEPLLWDGVGSGTANFPYLISPLEAIQARCRKDLTTVSWFSNNWDLETVGSVAQYQDVAIVFVNSDSGEDRGREQSEHNCGCALGWTFDSGAWIDHPNDIQLSSGLASPVKKASWDPLLKFLLASPKALDRLPDISMRGAFRPDSNSIRMKSYGDEGELEAAWAKGNVGNHWIGSSLDTWLHRPVWIVTYNITNTGSVAGAEVSQLYLEFPPSAEEPPSVLPFAIRPFGVELGAAGVE